MNKINKVIEESNKEFEEDIVPIIKNPLFEYAHTEGYEKPKKCAKEDIEKIKSFISQRDQKILSAIEEEVEGKRVLGNFEPHTDERYHQDSYNKCTNDTLDLLKSAKEIK